MSDLTAPDTRRPGISRRTGTFDAADRDCNPARVVAGAGKLDAAVSRSRPPLGTLRLSRKSLTDGDVLGPCRGDGNGVCAGVRISGGIGLGLGLILGLQRFAGDVAEPILPGSTPFRR